MPRRPRARPTPQLDLEWTDSPRWEALPSAVRDELRDRLRDLLVRAADAGRHAEGASDE
jgi:hypothetical protein